jgi:hypothetical protein
MITKQAINHGFKLFKDGFWRRKTRSTWQKYHEKICKNCTEEYLTITPNSSFFCSVKCVIKPRGKNHGAWKGGRWRSRGYVRVYVGRRLYRGEHVLLMEEKIGRHLKPDEHVHHINGIKDDNRLENLIVLKKSQHMSLHRKKDVHLKLRLRGKFHSFQKSR